MGSNVYGIDLGTCNIKIYSKNDDGIMIEKNMIAIENKKNIFYKFYINIVNNINIFVSNY